MNILNICEEPNVLTVFMIIKLIIKVAFILVPIIIIFNSVKTIYKAVIGKGDEIKQFVPTFIRSLVAGLVVFFIPTLFTYIFENLVPGFSSTNMYLCIDNANLDSINLYKEAQEIEDEEERKVALAEMAEAVKEKRSKEKAYNKSLADYNKNRVENEKRERERNNNSGTIGGGASPSSSGGTSPVGIGGTTIHIGDSRTVGMCASLTGDWTNCQFSNGGYKTNGDDIFIAQGSMGYSWFESTAVPAVNSILSSNPDTTYNIVSYMGVNFLLSDINKYIPKYNELANGVWKNQNIILVSVNPVNESVEAEHGYSTKNADIITFNTKLKNGISAINLRYCDVYNTIVGNFGTGDGLHYTSDTYKAIYSKAKSCI